MGTKFNRLKNDLDNLEQDVHGVNNSAAKSDGSSAGKSANYILLIAFLATLLFYTGSRFSNFNFGLGDITEVVENFDRADPELLDRMGAWMQEMGYGELTHEELQSLRNEGVTATETSEFRELGYTDLTLDQMVELKNADVSSTYARMMRELGYQFSVDDLVETRRNGVTAYFTSRMMDLGYTIDELTKENLIRLRSVGVSDRLATNLTEENGSRPTIDELIRYRISNQ